MKADIDAVWARPIFSDNIGKIKQSKSSTGNLCCADDIMSQVGIPSFKPNTHTHTHTHTCIPAHMPKRRVHSRVRPHWCHHFDVVCACLLMQISRPAAFRGAESVAASWVVGPSSITSPQLIFFHPLPPLHLYWRNAFSWTHLVEGPGSDFQRLEGLGIRGSSGNVLQRG